MNIYSIKEIVKATNNFLDHDPKSNIKKKNLIPENKIPTNTKNLIIEAENALILENKNIQNSKSPLVLENEIPASKTIDQLNYKINIKPEAKDHIIDELYIYLKKKIKKNTLKLIVDQQLEIKNLKNKIIFLQLNEDRIKKDYQVFKENYAMLLYNNEILKINNNSLQKDLNQVTKNKETTDSENNELKINLKKLEIELEDSVKSILKERAAIYKLATIRINANEMSKKKVVNEIKKYL